MLYITYEESELTSNTIFQFDIKCVIADTLNFDIIRRKNYEAGYDVSTIFYNSIV